MITHSILGCLYMFCKAFNKHWVRPLAEQRALLVSWHQIWLSLLSRAQFMLEENEQRRMKSKKFFLTMTLVGETPAIQSLVIRDNRTAYREFLTGFRKRKLQKTEVKKNKRIEREKKERLEIRRQVSSYIRRPQSSVP
jgi:Nucleolar protein 12 (25kDa)